MDQQKILVQVGNLGPSVIDHLISPLAGADNAGRLVLICRRPGPPIPKVEYHCPPRILARVAGVGPAYEFLNLLRLALFDRPSQVAGYLLIPHGVMAFVAAKLARRRLILSMIAGRAEFYTKGSLGGIDLERTTPPLVGRILLAMVRHADSVVTTGSVTKAFLVGHGVTESRVFPLISPANRARFFPTGAPKTYDVLSVGHLSLIKHHEVLLKTISLVKKRHPNVTACIVGDGPRRSELAVLARDLGIEENVLFAGFQSDTPLYYNSSRIFLHSSEREGFPNVFLEAMSCGLPSVVSNCGDIVDVAVNGQNSFLIPRFDDCESFAQAVTQLLEDADLYREMSNNALKTADSLRPDVVTQKWRFLLAESYAGRSQ